MDLAALFLLPIIAGYTFSVLWRVPRYYAARESGHKLYFRAAFYGFFLFLLVYAVVAAWTPGLGSGGEVPDARTMGWIAALLVIPMAMLLGGTLDLASRLCRNFLVLRAVQGDDFERLITQAALDVRPVGVTLKSGKVYIGAVQTGVDVHLGGGRTHISLVPILSGYRDRKKQVRLTTRYSDAYRGQDDALEVRNDLLLVLPVTEIETISNFDMRVWSRFHRGPRAQS